MITYNDIYEAARKERYSEKLQPLPKRFVKDFAEYLKEKKQVAMKKDDVFSENVIKTKKQIENATTSFKEIIRRRRKKILSLVLVAAETGISKQDFENMLAFEKNLFENLMKNIEGSDTELNQELNGESFVKDDKNELVVFKEDVAELVGLNGEKIGPYEKGQIANIPKEIATILLADSMVEVVKK